MDVRLQYFETQDNIKLYSELWIPDHQKANIIFLHGLGDHIGRYGELVKYFAPKGYGLCMYDQRGHGKSGGRRAHCKYFADFLRDLSQFIERIQEMYPNVPVFLMGHSFGGLVAINFVAKYSKGLRGLIALSPSIQPLIKIPNWKKKFGLWASRYIPIVKINSNINPKYLSRMENVVEDIIKDPLRNRHVTARLAAELLKNLEQIPKLAFQVKAPTLMLQAGDDRICSADAVRKFFHSLLIQNKDFKVYAGAYHELLHEFDRDNVFKEIEMWINTQLQSIKRIARANKEDQDDSRQTIDLWHHNDYYLRNNI